MASTSWRVIRRPSLGKIPFAGINITALGSTVQVGDGNYVNAQYKELHADLEKLREAILASPDVTDGSKVAMIADVEAVKMQLAKPHPDRQVIQTIWQAIERAATAAGLGAHTAALAARVVGLL